MIRVVVRSGGLVAGLADLSSGCCCCSVHLRRGIGRRECGDEGQLGGGRMEGATNTFQETIPPPYHYIFFVRICRLDGSREQEK